MLVVPGSQQVQALAEEEGLQRNLPGRPERNGAKRGVFECASG